MAMCASVNVADESDDLGMGTVVLGGWLDQEPAGHPRSSFVARLHGQDVLSSRVSHGESELMMARAMRRLVRTVEVFNGVVTEIAANRIRVVFDGPDNAVQAAIDAQDKMFAALPVSGVRLSLSIAISNACTERDLNWNPGSTGMAKELPPLINPGEISLCDEARGALSPTVAAKFENYNRKSRWIALPARPDESQNKTVSEKASSRLRLVLSCAGQVYIIDEHTTELKIGRDPSNQVVLKNRFASRHHAVIRIISGRIALVDQSSNGTFVSSGEISNQFLKNQECFLPGNGTITFSSESTAQLAAQANFQII